jgi:hypothetical protein
MEATMQRVNNMNNAATRVRTLHPYTRALSRDALLDEVDDRLFGTSENEDVEELLHLKEPGHGLTPGSA